MHRARKALRGNPAIERRPAERGDPYDVLKAEECGCGKRGGECRQLRFGRDEVHIDLDVWFRSFRDELSRMHIV
jgi:hypothetical protein